MPNTIKNPDYMGDMSPAEYFINLKNKDQEAYTKWKSTGSKRDLGHLMNQVEPLIRTEVKRAMGSLPVTALSAEAKKWTIKAIQSYDPSKGTLLSTHINNYLPKIRRMNYKFQNAVRLPENMQLKFHDYNHATLMLTEELNREPTDQELASKLGWSKPQTIKFKNSLYSDLMESSSERPSEYTHFNEGSILMEYIMSQLTEEEKFLLNNSKNMSSTELAARLGVNLNRLNYLKPKLIAKIKALQQNSGMM